MHEQDQDSRCKFDFPQNQCVTVHEFVSMLHKHGYEIWSDTTQVHRYAKP